MNEQERRQADALDAHISQRQAGQPQSGASETGQARLADSLIDLAQATRPDPAFAARLEARLRASAQMRARAENKHLLEAQHRSENSLQKAKGRMFTMNKALVYSIAGAALLALIALAAVTLINTDLFGIAPTQVAQQFTPTAGTTVQPTHTPIPPTVEPVYTPTATPTSTPAPQIALPSLAEWQKSGYGGGMGEPEPITITYVLGVALPEGPAQMTVYLQREPERLTAPYAAQFAGRLGVAGPVYQSIGLASADNPEQASFRSYLAADGTHVVLFDSSGIVHYVDLDRISLVEGYWREPSGVPALDAAIQAAKAFLQSAGLIDDAVQVVATGDRLFFYRVLGGQWPLVEPVAIANVWIDGQVGMAQIWPLSLDTLAEYPIISAQEAWSLLSSGQPDERVWQYPYHSAEMPAWGEWRSQNPAVWGRTYTTGQSLHRFGAPQVWFPTQEGAAPYIAMNSLWGGLTLTGDVQSLAEYARQQYRAEQSIYVHVWGQTQTSGGRPTLQVEGWEAVQETYWNGAVRRQGDQSVLELYDGSTILLPDLPADLADGTVVAVYGGQVDNRLEWHAIQEMAYGPLGQDTPIPAEKIVEQVDLVYLALPPDVIPPERYADLGLRAVQPVWRFRGHTDGGQAFEVYVQAVARD